MAAPREKFETYARASRKTLHKFPGNEWIVFGVEHQYLRGRKLSEMMSGIVKYAVVQFVPVPGREAISVAESGADVRWIAWIRSLLLELFPQDRPIDNRAIGNHFGDSWVQRRKNGSSPAETSANDEDFVGHTTELSAEGKLSDSFRQLADDIENVLVWRALEKLAPTLPRSTPTGIKNPISFTRKILGKRLLSGDRRHAIAKNNHLLFLAGASRGQELCDDFFLESGSEHPFSLVDVDDGDSPTEVNYENMNYIYGINAVAEALKARGRTFAWVGVAKERHDLRLKHVVDECRRQGVAVKFVARDELDHMAGNNAHQGVVAVTSAKQYNDLEDVVAAKRGQYSLMVVLDGVEDPHNLGAILRTADAAGADGVVIPERRAAGVTAIVTKTSAGASEHLPIAKVTNIARTLEELKAQNLWMVGLDERGAQSYDSLDYNMDCAIVLGAEGKGLHDLVARKCDFLVSIPMLGKVPSLNVSVAAGVILYEIVRQRRKKSA